MWTETEAKTKWCPETREMTSDFIGKGTEAVERIGVGPANMAGSFRSPCIASGCMMWRWAQKPNPDYRHGIEWAGAAPRLPNPMTIEDREHGYCGKAGRP